MVILYIVKHLHMVENLKKYEDLLPNRVTVQIKKTEDGLYAKILELPNCNTQADNFVELIRMVNDAIFSYLDIPEEHQEKLGYYVPAKIMDEFQRQRWQTAFQDLVKDGPQNGSPSIFNKMTDAVSVR